MKKLILFFTILFIFGCQNSTVEKPSNLIEKDKMIAILYDVSLLEAIKSQNINGGITPEEINEYIFKKYKIDSIQLVKSNKYYASDIVEYKKMYQKVKDQLEEESKKNEGKTGEINNTQDTKNSDTPTVY
ncbi:MAG TPA: DUF4296 domain-containing protein [Flavobacterium sp.]|jgi:hypothetical protein|uniref:DUF4296 domain-containing protein n=1 Tax=Flavobacterium sp. TaxID=239 RepID=UPI002BE3A400|nr:DUF4296 domain-containing protein [Flavobacterium sp.]MCA0349395.1 DUF4296 domain-containing protein [Bacteroidota bacterium]HPW98103.1 DUF4296 domain-containing protein [Flavobacterium sp.]HQA73878.1 DUF4296 domain-containing protein [Flavobacterium sp.]